MSKRDQLLVIICSVLAITSVASHLVAKNLKVATHLGGPLRFNQDPRARGTAAVAGSSLTFYGIAWPDVARTLKLDMTGYGVPGGSVREMEVMQRQTGPVDYTFIGISAYDINENHLSDFRSEVVPFWEEVNRLWVAHAEWKYSKRVLSQYPLKYIRYIYPTSGRATAVMVKVREILRNVASRGKQAPVVSEGAVVSDRGNDHLENISTWPVARMQRNIADIHSHPGATFEFHSTKRYSFFRFLHYGAEHGKVIVFVIPESPVYKEELVTADVQRGFEELIADAKKEVPEAIWIRLDEISELNSNTNYWDLIHFNAYGQETATKILLARLAAAGIQ